MRKIFFYFSLISLFFFSSSVPAQTQSHTLILRVDGLACPFCAYGLEKKIMKIEGVSSYDVDMKKGEVYIGLKDNVDISIKALKKAVKEAGFTLRGIFYKSDGKIEQLDTSKEE